MIHSTTAPVLEFFEHREKSIERPATKAGSRYFPPAGGKLDHRDVVLDHPSIYSGTIFRPKGKLYQTVPSRPSGTGRENHHPVLEFPDIRREESRDNLSPPTGPTNCSTHAPKWDNRCFGFSKPSFPRPLPTKPAQ